MKPAHKLLFVLCPMLVLGFIYYSSGKLHLHVWGQKPHKGVATTVTVSKVTKNAVKTTVNKEPVAEGPVSVGRIVGSVFDKQGFLLNLETKLPPELVYKYGNLSEGSCKPGYAAAKMTAIYPKRIVEDGRWDGRTQKKLWLNAVFLSTFLLSPIQLF